MIELIEIKAGSLRYSRADNSAIDCVARFSHMPNEWLPFTSVADATAPHAQAVWDAAQGSSDIAAYTAPDD